MNKYIDADKLIAEIESLKRRKGYLPFGRTEITEAYQARGVQCACDDIINIIASLQQEQPEVDLDDVIEDYVLENFGERWDGCVPVSCFELNMMANHFYELGFNARKGE